MKSVLENVKYQMIGSVSNQVKPECEGGIWQYVKVKMFNHGIRGRTAFWWNSTRSHEIHYILIDPIIDYINRLYPQPPITEIPWDNAWHYHQ